MALELGVAPPGHGSSEPVRCRSALTMLARVTPVRSVCSLSRPPFRMIKPVMRSMSASSRSTPSRSAMNQHHSLRVAEGRVLGTSSIDGQAWAAPRLIEAA